jgi:hypothetical protein
VVLKSFIGLCCLWMQIFTHRDSYEMRRFARRYTGVHPEERLPETWQRMGTVKSESRPQLPACALPDRRTRRHRSTSGHGGCALA